MRRCAGLVVVLLATLLARPASAATPQTFVVSTTIPTGAGSLNDAIAASNADVNAPAVDKIVFAIPGNGPFTIPALAVGFPSINEPLLIDGYTQGDATPGTPADDARPNDEPGLSSNAVLKIFIDGTAAIGVGGFDIFSSNVDIRGLAIGNFDNAGIRVESNAKGVRLDGNFIGTNVTGSASAGNGGGGIGILCPNPGLLIGGTDPAARNIISGNTFAGIDFGSSGCKNVTIQGNLIGTSTDGSTALPNSGDGIIVRNTPKSGILIGGTAPGAANVIANNGFSGIEIDFGGSGTRILSNSIFGNGLLGIDLDADGVTANDHKDPDGGTNHLQNFPAITPTPVVAGGFVTIKGTLDSRPNTKFLLQFFSNDAPDTSPNGEGQVFLCQKTVGTNGSGHAAFTVKCVVPGSGVDYVAATATNKSTGDTSEFSVAVHIP